MCVFCQIVNGELPSWKIYEDDKVFVFLDIQPANPGHTLVISKKHYRNIEDINEEDLTAIILTVKKIGRLLKDKFGVAGYNVTTNNDPVSGQNVPHIHFHVIPRHAGDGHVQWPTFEYGPGEPEEIIKKLTS